MKDMKSDAKQAEVKTEPNQTAAPAIESIAEDKTDRPSLGKPLAPTGNQAVPQQAASQEAVPIQKPYDPHKEDSPRVQEYFPDFDSKLLFILRNNGGDSMSQQRAFKDIKDAMREFNIYSVQYTDIGVNVNSKPYYEVK